MAPPGLLRMAWEVAEANSSELGSPHFEQEHRELSGALVTHTFDTDTFYLLVAHIEAEENELFPSAVCAFDDGGWDALEMAHRAVVEDAAG